jgi:NADPH-dependent 2,4-dienoyl-CoA reductase/sulfur reductase-like enzyme
MKTVIVGGVAGGATAAARLRRLDEKAEIIILERGEYVSFANCGLPYFIGGVIKEKGDLTLQTPAGFKKRFNIDVRVQNEAIKIIPEEKKISVKNLATGEIYEESYDNLILSPGAKAIIPNIKGIESGERNYEIEHLTEEERYNDAILTRLRTAKGLPLAWMKERFCEKLYNYLLRSAEKEIALGNLKKENGSLSLTEKGIFISDAVIRELIFI